MTNTLQIRLATMEDASTLANAGTRLFLQAYDGLIPTDEMTAHLAEDFNTAQQQVELADPAVVSILVESGSDIAGFGCRSPHLHV